MSQKYSGQHIQGSFEILVVVGAKFGLPQLSHDPMACTDEVIVVANQKGGGYAFARPARPVTRPTRGAKKNQAGAMTLTRGRMAGMLITSLSRSPWRRCMLSR
jgi:hypothetical protein